MSAQSEIRRSSRSGFIGSIIVNLIVLYVAHHVLDWHIGWITPAWSDVLWAVDLSLEVSIVTNLLFLAFAANWFRNLAGAVSCAVAALATWWIYVAFPFEFGSISANDFARLILLLVVLATVLATVVTAVIGVVELLRQGSRIPGAAQH